MALFLSSCVLNKKEREYRTCYAAEEDSQPVEGITRLQAYGHTYLGVKRISFTDECFIFQSVRGTQFLCRGSC